MFMKAWEHAGQKHLPPSYLYDEVGSALFEAITLVPEYGLTRADARLLKRHAAEIAGVITPGSLVAELGSGTGTKTRHILAALGRTQVGGILPDRRVIGGPSRLAR